VALRVHSARVSYSGPDAFNVTRQKGGIAGEPFAPSWKLLAPWLRERKLARLRYDLAVQYEDVRALEDLEDEHARAFEVYGAAYLVEMRASYRRFALDWSRLLARERVVLLCYCTRADRCHRGILRSVILPALGAVDCGEID
jgi:hypothetical protein